MNIVLLHFNLSNLHQELSKESWYDSMEFDGKIITVYQIRPFRLSFNEYAGYKVRIKKRPKFRWEKKYD